MFEQEMGTINKRSLIIRSVITSIYVVAAIVMSIVCVGNGSFIGDIIFGDVIIVFALFFIWFPNICDSYTANGFAYIHVLLYAGVLSFLFMDLSSFFPTAALVMETIIVLPASYSRLLRLHLFGARQEKLGDYVAYLSKTNRKAGLQSFIDAIADILRVQLTQSQLSVDQNAVSIVIDKYRGKADVTQLEDISEQMYEWYINHECMSVEYRVDAKHRQIYQQQQQRMEEERRAKMETEEGMYSVICEDGTVEECRSFLLKYPDSDKYLKICRRMTDELRVSVLESIIYDDGYDSVNEDPEQNMARMNNPWKTEEQAVKDLKWYTSTGYGKLNAEARFDMIEEFESYLHYYPDGAHVREVHTQYARLLFEIETGECWDDECPDE